MIFHLVKKQLFDNFDRNRGPHIKMLSYTISIKRTRQPDFESAHETSSIIKPIAPNQMQLIYQFAKDFEIRENDDFQKSELLS